MTIVFGLWLFFGNADNSSQDSPDSTGTLSQQSTKKAKQAALPAKKDSELLPPDKPPLNTPPQKTLAVEPRLKPHTDQGVNNAEVIVDEYIMAWRNKDKATANRLWATISECEACLKVLVNMIINKSLEDGMMLELAIKMTALDTNVVLPVFDVLIDPSGNRSAAIILSEKLMNNGRPEQVTKIFEVIYKAQQNGYENFARQLTWVISKLENQAGIQPILDIIVGRAPAAPDYADHVSSVFSKVVHNIPESESVANVIANYYQSASVQEQQQLWEVVSRHEDTLVKLASNADRNGQNYQVKKYATAITQLPNQQAVDGLVKLHIGVEYSPDYLAGMLAENVRKNPTVKVLRKLEDYMRDPEVNIESRIFAAEGLLAVRENRHARYMLEKVIKNPQYANPELQAYIGGRL
jgi:hypothetical protein